MINSKDKSLNIDNDREEVRIIDNNLSSVSKSNDLPIGFRFKTLGVHHLEEIYGLFTEKRN